MRAISLAGLAAILAACGSGPSNREVATAAGAGVNEDDLVANYRQLAAAMLKAHPDETAAQDAEELDIFRALLRIYRHRADLALEEAERYRGSEQAAPLEKAIGALADIIHEGGDRVREIRERLAKAGHRHQRDPASGQEYIIVDPNIRTALIDDGAKLRRLLKAAKDGETASPAEIRAIREHIDLFAEKAIAK